MHNHFKKWWERVSVKSQALDGWVHRITDIMFNSEDAKYFGTNWTDQSYKYGDVRIIMSYFLHGTHGPSKGIRRIILL